MMKILSKSLSITAVCLILPNDAWAGAWTAKQGETYLRSAVNYFDTSSRFGPEGTFENFQNTNFNIYLEHGLKNNLTVFATGSYIDLKNRSGGIETSGNGVGDVDIGLRYRLIDGPIIVSVQGLFKAPYLYNETAELSLGNGQEDFEGKLLLGTSFGSLGYGGLEVGYRLRAEDPVDEFRYLVEYGFNLNNQTYLRAKLDGTHAASFSDTGLGLNTPLANIVNPQLPLAFNLGRLEYTAGYKFSDRVAAEISGTTAVYGANTLKGTNIQFALVLTF